MHEIHRVDPGGFSMKERKLFIGLALATCLLVASASAQAQVMQLGRMPMNGKTKPTGLLAELFGHQGGCSSCDSAGCDGGCSAAPTCGAADPVCGLPEPGCGIAPTCGLAGKILGHHGGGQSCGVSTPICSSTGLGYSGGFGLSAHTCDTCNSCGVGGYVGRNIHRVNPCACGGSLIADMARGFFCLVDRAVGTVVGGVFGGLRTVTCHASGTFATLEYAAMAGCNSCGGHGCSDCAAGASCGAPVMEYSTYPTAVPQMETIVPQPTMQSIPMPRVPTEAMPPAPPADPFLDDPQPAPQARNGAGRSNRAVAAVRGQQLRQPQPPQPMQPVASTRASSVIQTAAAIQPVPQNRYLKSQVGRTATMRR